MHAHTFTNKHIHTNKETPRGTQLWGQWVKQYKNQGGLKGVHLCAGLREAYPRGAHDISKRKIHPYVTVHQNSVVRFPILELHQLKSGQPRVVRENAKQTTMRHIPLQDERDGSGDTLMRRTEDHTTTPSMKNDHAKRSIYHGVVFPRTK